MHLICTWNHFLEREWIEYALYCPLGLKSLLSALILGFVFMNRNTRQTIWQPWSRGGDRFGKVLKLKEPKESGEFVTEFQPEKASKNQKNVVGNVPPGIHAYMTLKTPWRGHSSSAFVSFDKHPRSRLFIEQSTWRGWAIESSQNSQNRNWNGTGALIKWSKTKPNGCVFFFAGCGMWLQKR